MRWGALHKRLASLGTLAVAAARVRLLCSPSPPAVLLSMIRGRAAAASLRATAVSKPNGVQWPGRAFLITTVGAEQRLDVALEELSRFGAHAGFDPSDVAIRTFQRDVDGARGCYASHLTVYREALAAGLPEALVLEDNLAFVELHEGGPPDEAAAAWQPFEWARSRANWDVLHLALVHSAASLRLRRSQNDGGERAAVVRVERTAPDWYGPVPIERAPGVGTSAYLISRRAMELLIRRDDIEGYAGVPIDDLLASCFPSSTFAACPVLLHRGSSPSLINSAQGAFRAVMYDPRIFRLVERALVFTGLSSSVLVWVFLGAMAAWTLAVFLPAVAMLRGS